MQASVICEFYSVGEAVSPVIADIVFNRHVVPVEHETLSLAAISASASRANTISLEVFTNILYFFSSISYKGEVMSSSTVIGICGLKYEMKYTNGRPGFPLRLSRQSM